MVLAAVETHPRIPVVLHQDPGASPAVCLQAIQSGFTSVMMNRPMGHRSRRSSAASAAT
jgi:fructose-bisphosphate aldolase class II